MTWRLEFDQQRKVICLTFDGRVASDEVRASSIAVISMVNDNAARNILTDFAGVMQLDVSTIDIARLPTSYKGWGLSGAFKEAIVAPKSTKIRKDVEFYETVCINRGHSVRIFEHRDQALDWLVPG